MEGWVNRVNRVNDFWLPLEKYGELDRDETFCLLYLSLLVTEIHKGCMQRAGKVALSIHFTHYGPRSGFQNYDLAIPPSIERAPLSAIWEHTKLTIIKKHNFSKQFQKQFSINHQKTYVKIEITTGKFTDCIILLDQTFNELFHTGLISV